MQFKFFVNVIVISLIKLVSGSIKKKLVETCGNLWNFLRMRASQASQSPGLRNSRITGCVTGPPIKEDSKKIYKCRILLEGGELALRHKTIIVRVVRNIILKRQPENVFFFHNFDRGVQYVPRST